MPDFLGLAVLSSQRLFAETWYLATPYISFQLSAGALYIPSGRAYLQPFNSYQAGGHISSLCFEALQPVSGAVCGWPHAARRAE
jgi:hypothetical protein